MDGKKPEECKDCPIRKVDVIFPLHLEFMRTESSEGPQLSNKYNLEREDGGRHLREQRTFRTAVHILTSATPNDS